MKKKGERKEAKRSRMEGKQVKGEKKKRRKSVEPLLASRNIFSSGCSSVRSVQPLPENSKRLPSWNN